MNKREFLNNLEQVLEVPEGTLKGGERLITLEKWDSMAVVSFIAMADATFGVQVSPDKLAQCKTVDDLAILMGDKITG